MTKTFKVVDGDVVINRPSGQVEQVADKVKLSQDVREMLLTDTQTDNGFGAGLDSKIGLLPSDELSPGDVNFEFGLLLRTAFDQLKRLQRTFQFGQRPLNELIDRILFLRASPDRQDPTLYRFRVLLSNLADEVVRLGGSINLSSGTG
jgi:hypothetical protein